MKKLFLRKVVSNKTWGFQVDIKPISNHVLLVKLPYLTGDSTISNPSNYSTMDQIMGLNQQTFWLWLYQTFNDLISHIWDDTNIYCITTIKKPMNWDRTNIFVFLTSPTWNTNTLCKIWLGEGTKARLIRNTSVNGQQLWILQWSCSKNIGVQ